MVNKYELRIGNKVLFCYKQKGLAKDKIVTITELLKSRCYTSDDGVSLGLIYNSPAINPVPLTAEMVQKCGFKMLNDFDMFGIELESKNWFIVTRAKGGGFFVTVSSASTIYMHFLHELQNMFFAFFGYDLEIKKI